MLDRSKVEEVAPLAVEVRGSGALAGVAGQAAHHAVAQRAQLLGLMLLHDAVSSDSLSQALSHTQRTEARQNFYNKTPRHRQERRNSCSRYLGATFAHFSNASVQSVQSGDCQFRVPIYRVMG